MAEATLNDVIKVLKQNDLNDGQDADRQYAKTEAVFDEIAKLNKMLGAHFLKDKANTGDDLEEKREKREKKAKIQKESPKGPSTFKEGFLSGSGLEFLKSLAGLPGALLTGVLGTKLATTLLPAFGKILGRTLSRGALFGVLAVFGKDLIEKGFEKLTGEELSDEDSLAFNDILKSTVLGSIFGKKGAFAGLIYGVVNTTLKKLFPNKDEDESAWQEKVDLMGIELPFTNEDFVTWGTTIASFFAPSLILRGIKNSLGIGAAAAGARAGAAAAADSPAKKGFLAGFKPNATFMKKGVRAVGWAALIAMGGSVLADVISEQTNGLVPGDLVNATVGGASMLALFGTGPLGIAAGLTYFAFEAGGMLREYLRERAEKAKAEFMTEVEEHAKRMDYANKSDAKLIQLANDAAAQAAARSAAGIETSDYTAKDDEALIQELQKRDPAKAEALFLAEEIGYLKAEIVRMQQLGQATPELDKQLKQAEAEYYDIAGAYFSNPVVKVNEPGQDYGSSSFLPTLPVREDFNSIFKSKRREDYNFKQAMKAYDKAIMDLMPPIPASGNGGTTVIDASSSTVGNSATALLSGTGAVVDRVSPHNQMWSSLR